MGVHSWARAAAVALTAALTVALAVPVAGLLAPAAHADESATPYKGKAVAPVAVRTEPTTAATRVRTLATNTPVAIECRITGAPVDGNRYWYLLGLHRYVTARYVRIVGATPAPCLGDRFMGRVLARPTLNLRARPTSASSAVGTVKYGSLVEIICKLNGQPVDGNPRWYQLTNGRWVTARYVANVMAPPPYCR